MARQLPSIRMDRTTPPRPWPLPHSHSRAGRIALPLAVAIVVLACTFDWNWCAPLVRHYIAARSGRGIDFDRMAVRFEHGLDPTIEFRNLVIQNAPWAASKAPFIRAARAAANVSWRSLGSDRLVVNRIELEDAQVDMERQADGLRNWRLTRPDDRGPARVPVLALALALEPYRLRRDCGNASARTITSAMPFPPSEEQSSTLSPSSVQRATSRPV